MNTKKIFLLWNEAIWIHCATKHASYFLNYTLIKWVCDTRRVISAYVAYLPFRSSIALWSCFRRNASRSVTHCSWMIFLAMSSAAPSNILADDSFFYTWTEEWNVHSSQNYTHVKHGGYAVSRRQLGTVHSGIEQRQRCTTCSARNWTFQYIPLHVA